MIFFDFFLTFLSILVKFRKRIVGKNLVFFLENVLDFWFFLGQNVRFEWSFCKKRCEDQEMALKMVQKSQKKWDLKANFGEFFALKNRLKTSVFFLKKMVFFGFFLKKL